MIGHAGERPLPEPIPLSAPTASAEVARTGHSVRVDGYGSEGEMRSTLAAALRLGECVVAVPVEIQGRLWGCVTASTERVGGFSKDEERLIERFASLVSASLANAQARARLRLRARLEETLREVAVRPPRASSQRMTSASWSQIESRTCLASRSPPCFALTRSGS